MKYKQYLFLICLFLLSSFCIPKNIALADEFAPPLADFSCDPSSGSVPLNVHFKNNCSGDIEYCEWDFGDGTTIVTGCEDQEHIYDIPGTYTVSLTIIGYNGSETVTCVIEVLPFKGELEVRATPLMIKAPWRPGTWWRPQTYDKHLSYSPYNYPEGWESARRAVDFYYANQGVCSGTGGGTNEEVRAAHRGTMREITYYNCDKVYTVADVTGTDLNGVSVKTRYIHYRIDSSQRKGKVVTVCERVSCLPLRSWCVDPDRPCAVQINCIPVGTQMTIDQNYEPRQRLWTDGYWYTWWYIKGDIDGNGTIDNDEKGWAAGNYLCMEVQAGDPIGLVSDKGCASSPHLMFMVFRSPFNVQDLVPLDDPNGVRLDGEAIFPGTPCEKVNTSDYGWVYRYVAMPRGSTTVQITLNTNPTGLLVSDLDVGQSYTAPKTFNWTPGSTHTISTPTPQYSLDGKTKYNFSSWSDGGALTHTITVPSSNTTYMATFTTQYLLDDSVSPIGSGGVSLNPSGPWYNPNQQVCLTANANTGYSFDHWSGDCTGTANPCCLTMNSPKNVTANFSPCTTEICDGVDNNCDGQIDEGVNCDDGDPCTVDSCVNGQCIHQPKNCDDGNPCTIDTCVNGQCVHQPKNCDDGNPCTIDSCVNGQCVHQPKDCDDGDPCTIDSCVNGQCVHQQINCDDGNPCTTDSCVNGQCKHKQDPNCCDDGDPCTIDSLVNGQCVHQPKNCDDGDPGTIDSCVNGQCVHEPIDCDDGNPCTIDSYVNDQCVHQPKNCDDGDPCTIDSCVNGQCVHQPKNCDDGNPCTTDYCVNGQCIHEPKNCDDGNPCTIDSCVNGQCVHQPKDCNDNDPCTIDFCDSNGQCVHDPDPDCTIEPCECPADGSLGCISGRVTNLLGQPLANKTIKLKRGTTLVGTKITDGNGCYRFKDLTDGTYKVILKCCKDCLALRKKRIIAGGGHVNGVNFVCEISSTTTTIVPTTTTTTEGTTSTTVSPTTTTFVTTTTTVSSTTTTATSSTTTTTTIPVTGCEPCEGEELGITFSKTCDSFSFAISGESGSRTENLIYKRDGRGRIINVCGTVTYANSGNTYCVEINVGWGSFCISSVEGIARKI